ncbi:MAG: ABC transporter substrate-binding protein [Halarcobacter sp.]
MKKICILLLLFSMFLFAKPLKKVVLQLNWLNQFQFAGYYMAKEKGFYKEVGLDVEIRELDKNIKLSEIEKNDMYDFSIARSSLIIDKINGRDVVALAAIFQESPLMLLTRKDSNINKPEDLKNKKIMITPDVKNSASILAMLYSKGFYNKDFTLLKHSFNIENLINKKVDAMVAYLSNEPIIMKNRNIEYNIIHPKNYGFNFYSDILFTSSKFIKKNPTSTMNFVEASLKGWSYAFENMTETAELIFKKYNTLNKSMIHLIKEGEILRKLAYADHDDHDIQIGCIEKEKLIEMSSIFKVLGLVDKDLDIDSFVYELNPHGTIVFELTSNEKNALIIVLFFSIFLFILIFILLKEIRKSRDLLNTVINSTNDYIFYKNSNFKYIGCNDAFAKFVGKRKSEIIGCTDVDLFNKSNAKKFKENDIRTLKEGTSQTYEEWIPYQGEEVLLQIKKIPFTYSKKEGKGIVGTSRDITALYKINEKLREQTYIDELTSIYNRKAYREKVKEHLDLFKRYKNIFSLMMLDIDDFKNINDTYGHDIGDKVLIEMTKTIKKNIRTSDIFFRIGGEEFIILIPELNVKNTFALAEKIKDEIRNMKVIDNTVITVSIGLVQVQKNDNIDTLFKRVDDLLYKSKKNGKNCISI